MQTGSQERLDDLLDLPDIGVVQRNYLGDKRIILGDLRRVGADAHRQILLDGVRLGDYFHQPPRAGRHRRVSFDVQNRFKNVIYLTKPYLRGRHHGDSAGYAVVDDKIDPGQLADSLEHYSDIDLVEVHIYQLVGHARLIKRRQGQRRLRERTLPGLNHAARKKHARCNKKREHPGCRLAQARHVCIQST